MPSRPCSFDTSSELAIVRHRDGIKLLPPDPKKESTLKISVADLLALPFNAYFLNPESINLNANENTAYTQSFKSLKDLIGKSVRDVMKPYFAEIVLVEDQTVFNSGKLLITENYGQRLDDVELQCLTIKYPWYNANEKLIGVLGISIMQRNYAVISIAESLSILYQYGLLGSPVSGEQNLISALPGTQMADIYLTKRETEVAKLLARGQTAKNIALQINRSKRTVEHCIERLKEKTGCSTKFELAEKIMDKLLA
jgi:DNA-binding CsgD family transcriptional regulator